MLKLWPEGRVHPRRRRQLEREMERNGSTRNEPTCSFDSPDKISIRLGQLNLRSKRLSSLKPERATRRTERYRALSWAFCKEINPPPVSRFTTCDGILWAKAMKSQQIVYCRCIHQRETMLIISGLFWCYHPIKLCSWSQYSCFHEGLDGRPLVGQLHESTDLEEDLELWGQRIIVTND